MWAGVIIARWAESPSLRFLVRLQVKEVCVSISFVVGFEKWQI